MAKLKNFVRGNVVEKEEDVMAAVSEVQAELVQPETTAATPQVAEQPTEKVGFFTKVKTGVQNAGKKLWDNRGKIGLVVGAVGTVAGAIAFDRIRNGSSQPEESESEIRDDDPELQALIEMEQEEKTEE